MKTPLKCQRCGEKLKPGKEKWLELSNTDYLYYSEGKLPVNHVSQGCFPFGTTCATAQMKETLSHYNVTIP